MAWTEERAPEVVVVPEAERSPHDEELAHRIRFEALRELRALSERDPSGPDGLVH